jgi:hypothetical protein
MATSISSETEPQKLSCSECLKEIPLGAAFTPEGEDYVGYYCGIECYVQFAEQYQAENQAGLNK